jgi:hypothetical protein
MTRTAGQWFAQLFPHAPNYIRVEVLMRLEGRSLLDGSKQVEAMTEAVVRHQFTGYDALRTQHAMTPEEARLIVADEISDLMNEWRGNQSNRRASR